MSVGSVCARAGGTYAPDPSHPESLDPSGGVAETNSLYMTGWTLSQPIRSSAPSTTCVTVERTGQR